MNVSDRIRNIVIRERCALQEDVVTRIVKWLLRYVSQVCQLGMMVDRRLTKGIYSVCMCGRVRSFRPRKTFTDQIGNVLNKCRMRSTRNRWECKQRLMNMKRERWVRTLAKREKCTVVSKIGMTICKVVSKCETISNS